MKFRLASLAAGDIRRIYDYLAVESPRARMRFEKRLADLFAKMRQYPEVGRISDRSQVRILNTVPFPYLVFYRLRPNEIVILRVLHGARNPRTMPARPS